MALAKVLVVEDDDFVRSLIVNVLESANLTVKSFDSAKSALLALDSYRPNTCLLDIDLGIGPTGIDLAIAIRRRFPAVGIVFLTSLLDPRLSRAGEQNLPMGSRYLTKNSLSSPTRLVTTTLSASLRPLENTQDSFYKLPLTSKQLKMLRLLSNGLTNSEIALQLGTSEKAVERLIARTLDKLEIPKDPRLNPRVQLVKCYSHLSGKSVPE